MMKSVFGLLAGVLFLLVQVAQAGDLEAGRKNRDEALRRIAGLLAARVYDGLYMEATR